MADGLRTPHNGADGVLHEEGRLVGDRSGQYGVSDERRAQLSQMEQDAGVQHEADDEGVSQQRDANKERSAGLDAENGAARPGDRH